MTWYLWGMRIPSQCLPNGLRAPTSDEITQEFVGSHFAFGNEFQCIVDSFLKIRHFKFLIAVKNLRLFSTRHPIEIQPLLVDHRLRVKILLLSFLEESSLINYPCFEKSRKALWDEFFLGPVLLIFEIMLPFFKWLITPGLPIFTSHKNLKGSFFDILRKTTSLCLSFDDWSFESVFICHMVIWYENEKKINGKDLLFHLNYTTSNSKNIPFWGDFWSWKIKFCINQSETKSGTNNICLPRLKFTTTILLDSDIWSA